MIEQSLVEINERLERIEATLSTGNAPAAGGTDFLDVDGVVARYSLKKSTLYDLTHRKKLPHYKIGKKIFFKISEIELIIEGGRIMTAAQIASQAATAAMKPPKGKRG